MTKVQPDSDPANPARTPKPGGLVGVLERMSWATRTAAVTALAIIGVLVIPASRTAVLRSVGWMLVAQDPLRPVDGIVIAVDARDSGVLEASDLVRSGLSRSVAVFADEPDPVDLELVRRGIPYEDYSAQQARLLRALGVEHVEVIPHSITGTEDEGRIFPAWCDEHQLRSVIVVTSADHTRRLRRVFRRTMKGRATTVIVRGSRYSEFDPDHWWQKRSGIRIEITELEKLLFDFVRYPIS
jgi:hypothetical protein